MMTFSECECGDDLGDTCECGDDTRGDEGHLHARPMCCCVELGALITSPLRLCAHLDMSPRLRHVVFFHRNSGIVTATKASSASRRMVVVLAAAAAAGKWALCVCDVYPSIPPHTHTHTIHHVTLPSIHPCLSPHQNTRISPVVTPYVFIHWLQRQGEAGEEGKPLPLPQPRTRSRQVSKHAPRCGHRSPHNFRNHFTHSTEFLNAVDSFLSLCSLLCLTCACVCVCVCVCVSTLAEAQKRRAVAAAAVATEPGDARLHAVAPRAPIVESMCLPRKFILTKEQIVHHIG